jgi:nucleoside-diphosphate-sugar epimerase
MKVCLLGGNGFLGPWVVEELERDGSYDLRITDLEVPANSAHETMRVDVSDINQVRRAATGCDVIVNCSVLRPHRQAAWDVNTIGAFNAMQVAVDLGHERVINTGPHFTVTGEPYHTYDFGIVEEVPAHAGTNLYALSKSTGQEICRIFAERYPIHVLCLLFLNFRAADPSDSRYGRHELNPFSVTFPDAARAIRCALETGIGRLPSRNEVFFIAADLPHGKYPNDKARRLLDWKPQDSLEAFYRRSLQPAEQ